MSTEMAPTDHRDSAETAKSHACPALAGNVKLAGELQASGFKHRQWLLQRDQQFIQVTELLYKIAEHTNGERTFEEIAEAVSKSTEWLVDADDIQRLIEAKLMPLGLIATSAAANAGGDRSPLAVYMRMRMISPRILEPLTKVFQVLYWPPILIPMLVSVGLAHWWMYGVQGLEESVRDTLHTPGGLLAVVLIVIASGFFHELGHASALRYGGGRARRMGVGLYLIYPAFFTDVTDGYRLGRGARIRTDLGGVYFHAIFVLGLVALSVAFGRPLLLFAALLINLDIARQFIPFVRLDGYWLLADITGIPDLFSQMGPFLRSVVRVPGWTGPRLPDLKPWVKKVFLIYIAATVPTLAVLFFLLIKSFPHVIITTREGLAKQAAMFSTAHAQGDFTLMFLLAITMLFVILPVLGTFFILYLTLRVPLKVAWKRAQPSTVAS